MFIVRIRRDTSRNQNRERAVNRIHLQSNVVFQRRLPDHVTPPNVSRAPIARERSTLTNTARAPLFVAELQALPKPVLAKMQVEIRVQDNVRHPQHARRETLFRARRGVPQESRVAGLSLHRPVGAANRRRGKSVRLTVPKKAALLREAPAAALMRRRINVANRRNQQRAIPQQCVPDRKIPESCLVDDRATIRRHRTMNQKFVPSAIFCCWYKISPHGFLR